MRSIKMGSIVCIVFALAVNFVTVTDVLGGAAERENIALNPDRTDYPHPMESDRGWGGGSNKWDIVDGNRYYQNWWHGLAFTGGTRNWSGEPAGERQATINFGESKTFGEVIITHHAAQHTPAECMLQYWDGSEWVDIPFEREITEQADPLDVLTFTPVTGSKIRYTFDNREASINGTQLTHGWIYEFEVYAVNADIEPPAITLNGDASMTLECNVDTYIEPGATVEDNCDPDVSMEIGGDTVDTETCGTYVVTYDAMDASGNVADQATRTVNVVDTTAPEISVIADPITLWPPNHKYKTIDVRDLVLAISDNCEDLIVDDVVITKVTSDEPEDVQGVGKGKGKTDDGGDGMTYDDIAFPDGNDAVDLRVERQAKGNGRVYTIHLSVIDEAGNGAVATCIVQVPHDVMDTAVDDGPVYEVAPE
jgi:hypothetical protein